MKVLMVVSALEMGGAQTHLLALTQALREEGVEVEVASRGGRLVPRLEAAGVPHHAIDFRLRGPRSVLGAARALRAVLDAGDFDVVHEHSFTPALAVYFTGAARRAPRVLTLHGEERRLKLLLTGHLPENVIAVSEVLANHARKRLRPARLEVIENGIDGAAFRPRQLTAADLDALELTGEDVAIVHVSRLSRAKGRVALALIDAVPTLVPRWPTLRVLIAGDGELSSRVAEAAAALNASAGHELVTILGRVADPAPLLAAAACVVGTGRVALEALACGVPVVAAGKHGVAGVVSEARFTELLGANFGDNGAWPKNVAANLAPELQRVLGDLVGHRQEAARIGERVREHHSARAMAKRVLSFYRSLVSDRS